MVEGLDSEFPVAHLVEHLLQAMTMDSQSMVVRTACMQWVYMILSRRPGPKLKRDTLERLFNPVFDTLLHPETEVVVAALKVLAQIMEHQDVEEPKAKSTPNTAHQGV